MNSRGQISLPALLLLPVILAIVTGLFLLAAALTTEAKAVASCRLKMEEAQSSAADNLNALLKLNQQAMRLRALHATAERAAQLARASRVPQAVVAAEATLAAILIQRKSLALKQQVHLLRGRSASAKAPAVAETSVRAAIKTGGSPEIRKGGLFAVVPDRPDDIAPVYLPAPGFAQLQKSTLRWKVRLQPDLNLATPTVDVGCSITLTPTNPTETEWKPQIAEDKLLSSSF